jgi:hypothetical protein
MRSNPRTIGTVLLSCVLTVATPMWAEDQPRLGVTVDDYMKMDRHAQSMYMVGLFEGFTTMAITARMAIAHREGRPDKEVEAELLGCRWDNYASIKSYVEAALHRIPRAQWTSTAMAVASTHSLTERFNAGCPWGK